MDLLAEQMAQRRERILESARAIVSQHGFEGLTMRELARKSRVTVPTIYNLVGSKDQVLVAAVDEQIERFVEVIESGRDADPVDYVLNVIDACVREMLRVPRYYRELFLHMFGSDAAKVARTRVALALRGQFELALADFASAGSLAPWVDAEALAERLRAQLSYVSIQWATGELTANGLKAISRFDLALSLAGATSGAARRELEQVAEEAQAELSRRGRGAAAAQARSRRG